MNSFHRQIEDSFGVRLRDTKGDKGQLENQCIQSEDSLSVSGRKLPPDPPQFSPCSFYPGEGAGGVGARHPVFWDRAMYLPQAQGQQANRQGKPRN